MYSMGQLSHVLATFIWLLISFLRFFKLPFTGSLRKMRWTFKVNGYLIRGCIAHVGIIKEIFSEKIYDFKQSRLNDVIDVGSNIGLSAIYFKSKGYKRIYCFEPDSKNFSRLKSLLKSDKSIQLINAAVSDYDGSANFNISETGITGRIAQTKQKSSKIETVQVLKIDSFVLNQKINPSAIKIDVEGEELNVLKGSTNTLKKFAPVIVMETHPGVTLSAILNFLKKYGYVLSAKKSKDVFIFSKQ
jgi:FkbM family methyltransferase